MYGVSLYFAFVGANVQFIYAMKTKNQERVRTVILVNWAFAMLLLALLVYGKITGRGSWNPEKDCAVDYKTHMELCDVEGSVIFSVRLAFVLFMVMAAYIYTKLWDVYPLRYFTLSCHPNHQHIFVFPAGGCHSAVCVVLFVRC